MKIPKELKIPLLVFSLEAIMMSGWVMILFLLAYR